jgi:hypothetical protein
MLKIFKKVTVYYEATELDGSINKGTDQMYVWEIPKWLTWMSPPSWAPNAINKGVKTVITRITYVN